MAAETLLCIPPDILADPGPAELAGDQPDCCFNPWMSDPVEGGGGRLAERRRYQGPKNAGGDVAEQFHSCNCPCCDEKRLAVAHLAAVGAGGLGGGQRHVVDGRRRAAVR